MATNYLSASLLSKNYQNMLDADDRENEKQIQFAFESARVSGSQIDADNLLRDDENLLLSFSDLENNSKEEYWQLKRIENTKPEIILGNVNSVLKEKRVFKELKESEPVSTPEEQANLEEILREKIKFYEELIQEAQGEG